MKSDYITAALILEALHTKTTALLGALARSAKPNASDLAEVAALARSLTRACGKEPRGSGRYLAFGPRQGGAAFALCNLHTHTAGLMLACARGSLVRAMGDSTAIEIIHSMAEAVLTDGPDHD